ncbi:hypothetical protein [Streptacidiphilus rugosus]|uniref:hypothetical protein n=1 Tax=Streptacidiphilus rugosus TaxID=405783 RepID=UPI00055B4033|nr:hypothetical protein [Streptacidiphilus rugosus]
MSADRRSRYLRVVRPGSGASPDAAPSTPPLPMEPPSTPPLWLDRPLPPRPANPPGQNGEIGRTGRTVPIDEPDDPVAAALRARLHSAVGGLQPAPRSLERLRHAVPQRRALRRRAYGGAAVAAALVLLGLTTLHTISPDTVGIAQSSEPGRQLPGPNPSGTGRDRPDGSSLTGGNPTPGGTILASLLPSPTAGGVLVPLPSGGVTSVATASHTLTPSGPLPECGRSQLGNGAAGVAQPDASGVVYGSFAVSNVSTSACQVSGAGVIAVLAAVGTDSTRFTVLPHTLNDPAGALPAPNPRHPVAALAPGQSYVIDFAWVPGVCASGVSTSPSGSPTDSSSPTPAAASAATEGAAGATAGYVPAAATDSPSGSAATGSPGPGSSVAPGGPSVQLGLVPAAGGKAAATTTLTNACAGTIYRTDPLAAPR